MHFLFGGKKKKNQIQLSSPLPLVFTPAAAESTQDALEQLSAQAPALDHACNLSWLFGVVSVEGLGFTPCTAVLGLCMEASQEGGVQPSHEHGQLFFWDPATNPLSWLAWKQCTYSFFFVSTTKILQGSKRLFFSLNNSLDKSSFFFF